MLSVSCFTFNPIEENTYIVYNEEGLCAIIDPGCYYSEEEEKLRNFIADNKLQPVYLLNTHCHLDHVFGNSYVGKTWNLDLHLHFNEEMVLAFAPKSGEMYGLPFTNYSGAKTYLEEGQEIKIGADILEVLFTPGHSPGSVSFYGAKEGFVISGDALFRGSIGRTDLPGGSFEVLEKAIKTQLYTLPDATIVYPGHGESTTIDIEKERNPYVRG